MIRYLLDLRVRGYESRGGKWNSIKTKKSIPKNAFKSDSDRIQTCNLLIRSQMLYSVELRSRFLICGCKGSDKT